MNTSQRLKSQLDLLDVLEDMLPLMQDASNWHWSVHTTPGGFTPIHTVIHEPLRTHMMAGWVDDSHTTRSHHDSCDPND